MKVKRFIEEQIIGILKQAEAGMKIIDRRRMHGISDATFYTWRKKYGGRNVSDAKRLKQLELPPSFVSLRLSTYHTVRIPGSISLH
ncbi:transposase [Geobacter anodireducens]|uniref:Transposase n=1 Tax=Geobacter anodireducens TaxID=1340425 RepID=A0ABR9NQU2_9BACT|nr:transposase [Geobacter anodireducens]